MENKQKLLYNNRVCVIIHFWKTEFYSNNVNP